MPRRTRIPVIFFVRYVCAELITSPQKTLENGVVYVPGEAFYHDKPDTRTLRLSYSTVSEAGLLTAVERLAASL